MLEAETWRFRAYHRLVATLRVIAIPRWAGTITVGKSGDRSYCNQNSDNHGRNLLHLMLLLMACQGDISRYQL